MILLTVYECRVQYFISGISVALETLFYGRNIHMVFVSWADSSMIADSVKFDYL